MRKLFAKIHLWLSIPFGIIIAIVCLTGAILVFETEILEICYPSRYFVKEVKGEPLPPAALLNAARQQLPDSVKINGLRVMQDPKRTYQVVLPGKKAAAFINPYTAEITGIDDGQGFFMQMMRLHRWLLDTYKRDDSFALGKAVVGYSTLVLAFILISGLVIWYPRNKKALKNRLKIKTKAGWYRFFYDLHVSGGFYATLLLLVLTLTGLTWSFGWYRDAFYTVFGVETAQTQGHTQAPASSDLKGKSGERGTRERGSKEKVTNYVQWATVLADLQNRYPRYNSITIQDGSATVSAAQYGNTRGSDRYTFDPANGEITDVQLYKDLPNSGKIRGWIYSVHVGSWGGLTTRILSCLVSFLGAVFAITGYYFWIKKKIRKKK
ncbi:PepSY domain-containing protein [Parabacteroides faecis]|uniref:PepSY-associated TM helix domain-containing protein n=1 Tax=Parabacteroides TaxID=375288 RepID=UPI000F00B65B|nr:MULTISPECIES: PepSY-associated TM helix domain-containing protein [Parabacteroides]MBC8618229.1 PepSY domain-containing protein [Parabacteroides faecis]RHS00410.1 PepSY domain-containing protein [Parabacteroides sp. AF14-59]